MVECSISKQAFLGGYLGLLCNPIQPGISVLLQLCNCNPSPPPMGLWVPNAMAPTYTCMSPVLQCPPSDSVTVDGKLSYSNQVEQNIKTDPTITHPNLVIGVWALLPSCPSQRHGGGLLLSWPTGGPPTGCSIRQITTKLPFQPQYP